MADQAAGTCPPEQFTTGACMYMGFPISALLPFVGNRIGSTNRRVDRHGHELASATLKGDGWGKCHDVVEEALAMGLKDCHVDAKLEVLNLFLPYCPAVVRSHLAGPGGRRNRQGVIPDLLAFFDRKRLIEIKGIAPCPTRHGRQMSGPQPAARCKVPGYAVDRRAETIPAEYVTKARKIDQKFNGTAAGVQGPFETALKATAAVVYGPSGRCVEGCAFGFFGGISGSSTSSCGRLPRGARRSFSPG